MDKQTKIIMGLLAGIIILAVIFTLKVTGVIKPTQNVSETNSIETNINEKESIEQLQFVYVVKFIAIMTGTIVMLIGFYRAYAKLGIPPILLILTLFVFPMTMGLIKTTLVFAAFGIVSASISLIYIGLGIVLIVSIITVGKYFKCLNMNSLIAWLLIVPVLTVFSTSFVFLNWIVYIILLVYYVISIERFARCFGKGIGFAIGIFFLPMIFIPIIGYSNNITRSKLRMNT